MTASAVFVKRDRTPVNGKHDHPSGARPPTALGVRGPRRRIVFNDDLIRTAVVSDRVVLTTANYNEMVIAIHAPIRDYERCVTASLGCDDCGAQLIEYR
jgi:hypothetical protein